MIRILSFDGGGIRGLMSAVWLKALEDELGGPAGKYFDLIAGTSTGSILAAAVASGRSADRIIELYRKYGREIFPALPSRLWSRALRLPAEGPSAPKYDGKGLGKVLSREFGKRTLGELSPEVLITSYDVLNREGLVFKSADPRYRDLPVWEVVRSSCSAPTFFPAHVMTLGGAQLPLVDGGVVANNPTACVIAEAIRRGRGRRARKVGMADLTVVSLGTGETIRPISIRESQEWGAIEWALPVIDVLFDGAADSTDYICKYIVPEGRYFRFQTRLESGYDDMDNVDATNLNALAARAEYFLRRENGAQMIGQVAKLLRKKR
jgi:uncharacterized protein